MVKWMVEFFSKLQGRGIKIDTVNSICVAKLMIFFNVIRNVIVVGYVHVSETIIVRLFQRNYECYCDYYFVFIVLNKVRLSDQQ